jgi:hypothetical protein
VNTAITDIDTYYELFSDVKTESAIGEASPTYIHQPRAAERIYHYIPHVKLIAILRHPADRAFSAYMHVVRDNREQEHDFARALQLEDTRVAQNWGPIWHYARIGYYYEHLRHYYARFPKEQIKIYLYDEFREAPHTVLRDIYHFLDVDTNFQADTQYRANVSGTHKNQFVAFFINTFFNSPNPVRFIARQLLPEELRWRFTTRVRNRNLVRHTIPSHIRNMLIDQFREDILKLEDLINRDLSHWLVSSSVK